MLYLYKEVHLHWFTYIYNNFEAVLSFFFKFI